MPKTTPDIVVLGGGTGSFELLQGIKDYTPNITSVVNVSDSGGSSGVLRDEYGVLPPGDARQCLVALSNSDMLRKLFNYRYDDGSQKGHTVGNIVISALAQITGSFEDAVREASTMLRITGRVLPVSYDNHHLVLHDGGEIIRGEHNIDDRHFTDPQTAEVSLTPAATLNPEADEAIRHADLVVIAPGSVYTSLLPLFVVDGMKAAIDQTAGRVVAITNLVTKPGQTDGWHAADHVKRYERYLGQGAVDVVLYNNTEIAPELLGKYAAEGEYPVSTEPDRFEEIEAEAIGARLVSDEILAQDPADTKIRRTLIRHDGNEVGRQLMRLFYS